MKEKTKKQSKLVIRRFEKKDTEDVFHLHLRAIIPTGAYLKKTDNDFYKIEADYLKSGGDFLIGLKDDIIVAIGGLKKISFSVCEITKVRIDPRFQQQGFGQQILDALETRAKELGFTTIELNTAEIQVAAQKLYEKNGYVEFKRGLVDGIPNIYYEKKI